MSKKRILVNRSAFRAIFRIGPIILLFALTSEPRASDADSEWISLVTDGRLSSAWETKGNWHVEKDGAVVLTPRPGEKGWNRFDAYIWSKKQFDNFEVEFDYRLQPKGNSGFYFHVGDKSNPVKTGIEVQIFDSAGKPATSKLTDHDSGGIIPGIPPLKNASKPAGEWNRFQIAVNDQTVRIVLNGVLVNEVKLSHPNIKDRPGRGYIGFQDHSLPLSLRRVRIREL